MNTLKSAARGGMLDDAVRQATRTSSYDRVNEADYARATTAIETALRKAEK